MWSVEWKKCDGGWVEWVQSLQSFRSPTLVLIIGPWQGRGISADVCEEEFERADGKRMIRVSVMNMANLMQRAFCGGERDQGE